MRQLANSVSVHQSSAVDEDFKLLRYFGSGSLLAFVLAAALLGYVFRQLSVDALVHSIETQHVTQARILSNRMWNSSFEPLIQADAALSDQQLRGAPQIAALHQETMAMLEGTGIFKIKVYDLKGRTVYASTLEQIGQDKSSNAGVIAALAGHTSSELVHENQFSTAEGAAVDRDLVESYIPHLNPQTNKVSGVFEVYGNASPMLREISHYQALLVGSVVGLLAILYLVVFAIVRQAQKHLRMQSSARKKAVRALGLSEERWKFALEGSGEGVWDRDLVSGRVIFSRRYKEIYGFTADELENQNEPLDARVHPDDLAQVVADREAYFKGTTGSYVSERRMQCKDGSWKWVLSRGMVVARDPQGKPLRMIGTHNDITERHEREQQAQLAATVLQTMAEAVTVTDAKANIVSVNPAFTTITGYTADDVIGLNPRILASGRHPEAFYHDMWQQLSTQGRWQGEICNRHKNGRSYFEWLSIKKIVDPKGQVTNFVAVFSDISARKANEMRMQRLAHFDPLTDLPNRTLLADRLHQGIAQSKRERKQMALLFIDLDRFKPVNDALGHTVGDLLLKAVAERLLKCVQRESDTVARVGGDEFVVLLMGMDNLPDAWTVAVKIRDALAQPFYLEPHTVPISASIGIAIFPDHGSDGASLIKHADAAMYQAKASGRNQIMIFTPDLVARAPIERDDDDLPTQWQSL